MMRRFTLGVALSTTALSLLLAPCAAHADAAQPALYKKLDLALERYYAHDYKTAAPALYAVFAGLPEAESKRDIAEFNLAGALSKIGYSQAAIELYVDIVTGRRSPELVGRSLGVLEELVRKRELSEERLIDEVLFGNQYGDLPLETEDFVEYYQALGELRRGYPEWATKRLELLANDARYYSFKARYVLAVQRWEAGETERAVSLFRAIIANEETPAPVRNDSLVALARRMYEQHRFNDAFELYAKVDSPLPQRDVVLLEQAWDRVAAEDEKRALGMVVGLGAPVYQRLFAPEKVLINAMAFNRMCQFQLAHLAVADFPAKYGATLKRIREQQALDKDPILRDAVSMQEQLRPTTHWREQLTDEQRTLRSLDDAPLRKYLERVYQVKIDYAKQISSRAIDNAYEELANDLLRIDEQMKIIDYEIGVGLFKRAASKDTRSADDIEAPKPRAGEVRYRFDGEYWSDELQDYVIVVENRCIR